jgi:ammonia channel protein AmtB
MGKPRNQRQNKLPVSAGLGIVLQNKMRDCILISAFWAVPVAASISFAFAGSLILLEMTDALVGLRVSDQAEHIELALGGHYENAYDLWGVRLNSSLRSARAR